MTSSAAFLRLLSCCVVILLVILLLPIPPWQAGPSKAAEPPVAVDDSYSTDRDTTLSVPAPGVLGNDSDPDGDRLTAVLDTGVSHGTLTLKNNGSFTYTPDTGFVGDDSFTYHANDGTADSNVAAVTITINGGNVAPVAVGDSYSTDEDTTLNVPVATGVLANDSDSDGPDPLAAVLDTDVSHGSLTLNADGSFTYSPNSGYTGQDSFTYHATDGAADSNIAKVTIWVGTAWTRTLDPAILSGGSLPAFAGVAMDELFVYAYEDGAWVEVPFQIDEVTASGEYTTTEDILLDDNDELVFMATDAGQKVTTSEWIANPDSRSYTRYEVEVTNPLNSEEKGWVYVYRSATLTPSFDPYVTWNNAQNRLDAGTYVAGFDFNSHLGLDSLELNGSGVDVLDRSKIRLSVQCYAYGNWYTQELTEESDDLKEQAGPPTIQGPVRQGGGTLDTQEWYYASLFVSNFAFDAGEGNAQCDEILYDLVRLSDDWLNPSETGMAPMIYYDSNTTGGVTVDGDPDTVADTPVAGWQQISGNRGSVVRVMEVVPGGGTASNYYKDDDTVDPDDTGEDQRSYADRGYQLENPDALLRLDSVTYLLGANEANVGTTYEEYRDNPIQTAATPQDYNLPPAPILYAIDNADGDGNYVVDWSDVTGATGYILEEADNADFLASDVLYTGNQTQYQVSGQEGGVWYYRVRASNEFGDGTWSDAQSAGVIPDAPVLDEIGNADEDQEYRVDWSDVIGAETYTLEEDDDQQFRSPTVRYSGPNSYYDITVQMPGVWYYRVRASNAGGDSVWSNTVWLDVPEPPIDPPVLSPIDNRDGDGDYLVDWSDVQDATTYTLQEDEDPNFNSPVVRYSGAQTRFDVTDQVGGTFYYRVYAANDECTSSWSNTEQASVIPNAPVLAAIDNPEADGEYVVDWDDVTGAANYELEEADNKKFKSAIVIYSGTVSEYQVSGQEGGLWYYRVRASNPAGNSPWSNIESMGVVPAAPVLDPIDNPGGIGEYLVDWGEVTSATTYQLEEADDPEFGSPTLVYSGSASQYQVSAHQGGLWYYRVRARNEYGDGAWSDAQSAGVAPVAPVLPAISNPEGDGDYLVDWNDVTGATSYELEEAEDDQFSSATVVYSGTASEYQVSANQGGLWYYRVRAGNTYGDSPWSNTESAGVVPEAPTLEPIDNPDAEMDYLVDWNDVTGATSYELEEAEDAEFSSPTVIYTETASQHSVNGQEGGEWFYRVRALNVGGPSAWSNIEDVGVIPAPPALAHISNPDGDGEYLLDWNDVTGATAYRLEEDDNSGFTSPTVRYTGADSKYQVNGQGTGRWYYRVRASNDFGNGAWSNVEDVGVIPAAPVLAAISNPDGDGEYVVDWNTVTGATSYRLEEDDNSGFTSPAVRYTGGDSEFLVSGQEGGVWYYRVRASNAGGDSLWSTWESVAVIPAAPVLYPISNPDGDGDYLVDWSDVTGATAYCVAEDDNPAFTSPIILYCGASSRYQVYGQRTGRWYYRVRASNAGGNGPWSNIESVGVVPAAPVLADIENDDADGEYLVDWSDVAGATSYWVEEDDNPTFHSPIVRYNGVDSQFLVSGQGTGVWYYRVRAVNAGGDGPWSNSEFVTVGPAGPVLYDINNPDGDGEYVVDWSDVTGATSYQLEEDDNCEFSSPTVRYAGTNSQYHVTGQEPGLWFYRVRAYNADGPGLWSNMRWAGVLPAAPILPKIVNDDGDAAYLVDWSDVTGATYYELQEDDNPDFTSPTVRYVGLNSQYQVYGQGAGLWYYRVRVTNAAGEGPWSSIEPVEVKYSVVLPYRIYLPVLLNSAGGSP